MCHISKMSHNTSRGVFQFYGYIQPNLIPLRWNLTFPIIMCLTVQLDICERNKSPVLINVQSVGFLVEEGKEKYTLYSINCISLKHELWYIMTFKKYMTIIYCIHFRKKLCLYLENLLSLTSWYNHFSEGRVLQRENLQVFEG